MRQEAEESGLKLQPADTVWVPDDLDFGVSDSMTRTWWIIEYMPITHQVSFSGAGNISRWFVYQSLTEHYILISPSQLASAETTSYYTRSKGSRLYFVCQHVQAAVITRRGL